MPGQITGTLLADFGSFYTAVDNANVKLRSFESGASNVEKALNNMVDRFSGRRLIQEAELMVESIQRIGSPARLTANELQRAGAAAEEAAEKLRRMGQQVPPRFDELADKARRARGESDALREGFQAFDGVAQSLGVHLPTKAIEDLGRALTDSKTTINAFGQAGLVAGAAFAGWEVGRWIAGLGDLDKKIGDTTAKLLGMGDVAAEEAAAGADTLARASKIAGVEITSMDAAIAILSDHAKTAADDMNKFSGALKEVKAPADVAANLEKIGGQLEILKTKNEESLGDLNKWITANEINATEIARMYTVSTEAAQRYITEVQRSATIEQSNHDKLMDLRRQESQAIEDKRAKERAAAAAHEAELDREREKEWALVEAKHQQAIAADEEFAAAQKAAKARQAAAEAELEMLRAENRRKGSTVDYSRIPGADLLGGKTIEDFQKEIVGRFGTGAGLGGQNLQTMALEWFKAAAAEALRASATDPRRVAPAAAAPTTVNATVHVSGVFDDHAKEQLKAAVSSVLMDTLTRSRHLPGAVSFGG